MNADFLLIFGSIMFSFCLGGFLILFVAGRTSLNYLLVKVGRGKKILVFADTKTGRKSFVGRLEAKEKKGVVSWTCNGTEIFTDVHKENFARFYSVYYIGVSEETPEKPYVLTPLGEVPVKSIDNQTFSNILNRAMAKPMMADAQAKMIKIVLFLLLGVAGGLVFLIFKMLDLTQVINGLGVL